MVLIGLLAAGCGDADSVAEPPDEPTTTTSEPVETVEAEVVEETAEDPSADEYLELSYWEGALPEGFTQTHQPDEECDNSDPDVFVCEFTATANLMATQIGYVSETASGTTTTYLTETCEPPAEPANRIVREASGVITTKWGDELHFEYRIDSCTVAADTFYWIATGGTGRFEGASGVMSAVRPALQAGYLQISTGTLKVRKDLWEEIIPSVASTGTTGSAS